MDRLVLEESDSRFVAFIGSLNEVIGHRDRTGPFRDYCAGLLAGCERKSVEPLAAITAPARVSAQHQSLLHFVGKAPWSDDAVLGKLREMTLPVLEKHGPVEAWIVDDTGFPKKGKHSVGVARQGSLASRIIAKPRFRSRSPTSMRAFPSRIGFICRRTGLAIRQGGRKRACPAM